VGEALFPEIARVSPAISGQFTSPGSLTFQFEAVDAVLDV